MPRKILISIFIVIFADMLGLAFITPFMSLFADKYHATGVWLGIIYAALSFSRLFSLPFFGKLSDRFGKKRFICLGLFLYVILALAYLITDYLPLSVAVPYIAGIRFARGITSAMIVPIARAYIGESSPKGKEGHYMGIFNVAFFTGTGMGPIISGFVYDLSGWETIFYTMSGLWAFAFLVALLFVPASKSIGQNVKKATASIWQLLKHRIMLAVFVIRAITGVGTSALTVYSSLYVVDRFNVGYLEVGLMASSGTLLSGIMQGYTGRLADKYSKRLLIILGNILAALPFFLIPLSDSYMVLLAIRTSVAFGPALSMPACAAIVTQVGRKFGMGSAHSIFNMAMTVGHLISPILFGYVLDVIKGRNVAMYGDTGARIIAIENIFYIAGIIGIIGSIVFYLMTRSYTEDS